MRVLLVGDGAREHVIAKQLARSCELYSVMSKKNPGIAGLSVKYYVCPPDAVEPIGSWAIQNNVELAFVTSESALANGLTDALADAGISLACPSMAAAAIGNNTIYAENLIKAAGIPHPDHRICKSREELKKALDELKSVVIKPAIRTELRGAKFTVMDFEKKKDAIAHGASLIKRHGSVVLEKIINGEVFSVQAFTDGKRITTMPPVQVATRAEEGDEGELTEGMGGFSTGMLLPFMKASDYDSARDALEKIVSQLAARGIVYKGALHGRFIATSKGVQMIDLNSTLGSVETVNNLGVLRSQLSDLLNSIAEGNLQSASFDELATVVKFVVPKKYPKASKKKERVEMDEKSIWENGANVFFESADRVEGRYVTGEGRTLAVFANGKGLADAEARVEAAITGIKGNVRHRKDIGTEKFLAQRISHMKKIRG